MSEPTQQEYFSDVESIAREAFDAAVASNPSDDVDDIRDACVEATEQDIDSSQWVIYTYRASHVLMFSSNGDAIFDEMGATSFDSCADFFTKAAYFAMRQDVAEALETLLADYEPVEADDSEES